MRAWRKKSLCFKKVSTAALHGDTQNHVRRFLKYQGIKKMTMGKCCEMHPPCVTHEKPISLRAKKVTAGFMPDTQQGYGLGAETALPSRNWIEFRAFRNNHSASVLKTMSKQDERGTDLP